MARKSTTTSAAAAARPISSATTTGVSTIDPTAVAVGATAETCVCGPDVAATGSIGSRSTSSAMPASPTSSILRLPLHRCDLRDPPSIVAATNQRSPMPKVNPQLAPPPSSWAATSTKGPTACDARSTSNAYRTSGPPIIGSFPAGVESATVPTKARSAASTASAAVKPTQEQAWTLVKGTASVATANAAATKPWARNLCIIGSELRLVAGRRWQMAMSCDRPHRFTMTA